MSNIQPAATLLIIRDQESGPEVLLVKRHEALSFASGCWVFPGGKVDSSDTGDNLVIEDQAKKAAVRETLEETSLLIRADNLVSTNHWTTPHGSSRRFATWFFITHYSGDHAVKIDGSEIVDSVWLNPKAALRLHQNGQMPMLTPTHASLEEIASFDQCANILQWYRVRSVKFR